MLSLFLSGELAIKSAERILAAKHEPLRMGHTNTRGQYLSPVPGKPLLTKTNDTTQQNDGRSLAYRNWVPFWETGISDISQISRQTQLDRQGVWICWCHGRRPWDQKEGTKQWPKPPVAMEKRTDALNEQMAPEI